MKKILILFLLAFLSTFLVFSQRSKELMNFNWKHTIGDFPDAKNVNFNDKSWNDVNLPHDASIYGDFVKDTLGGSRQNGYRPRNIGWYRKSFSLDENKLDGKKIYLEFEAVHRASEVWVNGQYCGKFLNGYLDFQYDVTDKLKSGKNVISVRYDNTFEKSSRWYTGEGIHRDVYLHFVDFLHVDRYGTYVKTPFVTNDLAKVEIETAVINNYGELKETTLISEIVDPFGNIVASQKTVVPINISEQYKFKQQFKIVNPKLWDIIHPFNYEVVSKLFVDNELKDVYHTDFGVRTVEFTSEQGFLLNERKVFLKGVNLHHDLGPLGAASFEKGWEKRLSILKNELGINAIRLSHNPYPKYVLDWCDKNGILVFHEFYDKWDNQYYGPGNSFKDNWKSDVETALKRDRNHPSIFIWSVGNEVYHQIHKDKSDDFGVSILKEMVDFVHSIEPTRNVTCGLFPRRYRGHKMQDVGFNEASPPEIAFYMDVMSVNYMERFFAQDHEKYPQLVFMLSEATTGESGITFFDYDHSYTSGHFYWGGTEYIGESFGWPSKGWVNGLLDMSNNLKSSAQSVRSFYSVAPMVHAVVLDKEAINSLEWNEARITWKPKFSHWNWKDGEMMTVEVLSNCYETELFLNGKSLGVKQKSGSMPELKWDVKYEPGELIAVGWNYGRKVAEHVIKTAGKPHKIILEPDKTELDADGLDLVYFDVKVVDKNGVVVPNANNNIQFSVNGDGVNAGVGNGDINSNELWQNNNRSVYQGQAQLIIRASQKAGKITVEAKSKGLGSDKVVLITK